GDGLPLEPRRGAGPRQRHPPGRDRQRDRERHPRLARSVSARHARRAGERRMTADRSRPLIFAVIAVVILALMLAGTWAQSNLDEDRLAVFVPQAEVHGASYGEWSARHWQWTTSLPAGMSPGQDATGAT